MTSADFTPTDLFFSDLQKPLTGYGTPGTHEKAGPPFLLRCLERRSWPAAAAAATDPQTGGHACSHTHSHQQCQSSPELGASLFQIAKSLIAI